MGVQDAFCKAPRLEQGKAEQHGISHASPDSRADVAGHGDIPHQHRIDTHADNDQKRLESQGEQGAEIVLSHLPPFPVEHGRHGDRGYGSHQINLHHTAIDDDKNTDGQRPHGNADKKALEPQAE